MKRQRLRFKDRHAHSLLIRIHLNCMYRTTPKMYCNGLEIDANERRRHKYTQELKRIH